MAKASSSPKTAPDANRGDWEQTIVAVEAPPEPETSAAPHSESKPEAPDESSAFSAFGQPPEDETPGDDDLFATPDALDDELGGEPTDVATDGEMQLESASALDEDDLTPETGMGDDVDMLAHDEHEDAAPSGSYAPDLEKFVKHEGGDVVIRQPYLEREKKAELENRLTPHKKAKLRERRWIPRRRESRSEIGQAVDALNWKPRYEPKAVAWLHESDLSKSEVLRRVERIPANIVDKRVVYETEGGFVVEVVYRELGQTRYKFFTVPARGGAATTLNQVRSGVYAEATAVNESLLGHLTKRRTRSRRRKTPGKIVTWPIQNKYAVDRIVGLNKRHAATLAELGISTTDELRVRSPVMLARHVGVPSKTVQGWQWAAELMLVHGMAEQYAHLLVQSGVEGLDHFRGLPPKDVVTRINSILETKRAKDAPRPVGAARSRGWLRRAKALKQKQQDFPASD